MNVGRVRLLEVTSIVLIAALVGWIAVRPLEGSDAVGAAGLCRDNLHCTKSLWNTCAGPPEKHCSDYDFTMCESDPSYGQWMCILVARGNDRCVTKSGGDCFLPTPLNYECYCQSDGGNPS